MRWCDKRKILNLQILNFEFSFTIYIKEKLT